MRNPYKYYIIIISILITYGCNSVNNRKEKIDKTKKSLSQIEFINNKKFKFGKVKRDTIITNKFIIKNTGNKPLILKDHRISCNCTNVKISKKIINPRDTACVELKLDTRNKNNYVNIYCILIFNTKQKYYKISMSGSILNHEKNEK